MHFEEFMSNAINGIDAIESKVGRNKFMKLVGCVYDKCLAHYDALGYQ